ncbi:ABC transporter [Prauserella marina]|uniref:ABC-2 type transport system ATP-binding protein n=1 Tax=Prauserella marina TaxID=530584 RepID=A0A222VVQ2_9PSEU|nr:ATP-binding cassette domain-containing protein [Prauserella marina]ASR37997.1 ABC transporter [Prauserella marina]PWV73227.1 ABC-2 type transport system ATP-binding protein [Prauserella marina]SDD68793.1 ABC-2 type transport system ATP-binding protein [Prauserella marina]
MTSAQPAVLADGLRKRYGDTTALDHLDLAVTAGTVHGLLGPNGAGKTTAVRILTTLTRPDGGTAEVAGYDVVRDPAEVRYRIGLVGQHAALDEILSGRQNLVLFGRLYHLGSAQAQARADELLRQFQLTDAGSRPVGQYSGGMRRRLDLAASLILAPPVLFLDEPTTGLDPRARTEVWKAVRELAAAGTTVLLTTQYLEEADQLADRVSLVDDGKIITEGSPAQLKRRLGADHVDIVAARDDDLASVRRVLARIASGPVRTDEERRLLSAPVHHRASALTEVVRDLDEAGITALDISLRRPTLDEVFLELTGPKENVA